MLYFYTYSHIQEIVMFGYFHSIYIRIKFNGALSLNYRITYNINFHFYFIL